LPGLTPSGVGRGKQAVLYKGDMKRDWSGCERRRSPAAIADPSAARRSRSDVYPALRPGLQRHVRTRPFRGVLTTPSTVTRPGSAVAAGR